MSELSREDRVYLAKLAEQAERYSDMCKHMRELVKTQPELTVEERNLLSVAYKNVVGAHRASWRIVNSIAQKNEQSASEEKLQATLQYKKQIKDDLREKCDEILAHLSDDILNRDNLDDESKVFYFKMQGDYQRYVAEFESGEDQDVAKKLSLDAYNKAKEFSEKLATTHPIRLGLALNFSVFYYEIMKEPDKACTIAKGAFDDAIADLDTLSEDSYKDSTLIMQLLRDNLTLWTSDNDMEDDIDGDVQDNN